MRKLMLAIVPCLLSIGCTSRIGYPPDREYVEPASHRLPIRVAVLRLQDRRPTEEVQRDDGWLRRYDHTQDSRFEHEDVARAISEAVARHLEACGLFARVEYVHLASEALRPEDVQELRRKGFDLAIIGEIEHFRGMRRLDLDRGAAASALGPIGTAANAALGHDAEGHVSFRPVQAIRTRDGAAVWQGQAEGKVERREYLFQDAGGYANEALSAALNDLVAKLDSQSGPIAVEVGCERSANTPPARGTTIGDRVGDIVDPIRKPVEDMTKPLMEGMNSIFDGILG